MVFAAKEFDVFKSLVHKTDTYRICGVIGLAGILTRTLSVLSPATSAFHKLQEMWTNADHERELWRHFRVIDSEESTLDLVLEPNPEVEHSYELVQVEVPFEGGIQMSTYSPSYGGYVVRTPDNHYVAKKIHVYNPCKGCAEYTWTYTALDVLDEIKAGEDLLRCGSTESPLLGAEPLVRVPDEQDSTVWLSSNAQGTGPWALGRGPP